MRAMAFVLVACLAVGADDKPAFQESEGTKRLREQYLAAARKYEFHFEKDRKAPLVLEEKPIFHWASDNDWSGDVFVWMAKGRPQVVGCVLSSPGKLERPMIHEFHTLSTEPLTAAEMAAGYRWAPKGGIEFKKLDGAPSATAAGRLPQMRALARDLHVFMQAVDGKWELRLLPQPLMRYQPADGDVIDGAIFSWVWTRGTDPEVLVAVECHRTAQGLEWRYAPMRFTTREVWLLRDDRELWRVPVHREDGKDVCTGLYTTRPSGKSALVSEKQR